MACRGDRRLPGPAVLVLLVSSPAMAGAELGVGLDLTKDLPDVGVDLAETDLGFGTTLRAPLRYRFGEVIALRSDFALGISFGHDRVEWRAYEAMVPVYSDTHKTTLTSVGLMLGPEISPWADQAISPYLGSEGGFIWARHWHRFEGQEERLLGLDGAGGGIHPYTDQLSPAVGLHGGVRTEMGEGLAIEVEVGYNVAFMREARLAQAPPSLDAVRTAYGLNQFRVGLNLVIPLARGSES